MHNVSQSYLDSVYATSRRFTPRVTFDIKDVTAQQDVQSITASTEAIGSFSKASQIVDGRRLQPYNPSTFETNRFRLDGTFTFVDESNYENNNERGWVSSSGNGLSQADGTFATPPVITIQFNNPHDSVGITVTFDPHNKEYATDYDMVAYNAGGDILANVQVTGNTSVSSSPISLISGYTKLVLTIRKWCRSDRRARVVEVDMGVLQIYDELSVVRLSLSEDMYIDTTQAPSSRFSFTLDNSNKEFNILNPAGFYSYLQQKQKVTCELGLQLVDGSYEYVPIGQYYLSEWKSEAGSLTTSFTAMTVLDLMSSYTYLNVNYVYQSLSQLAKNIFALCGVEDYIIDGALDTIYTNSIMSNTNCRQVLQMIAIAGCCNIYVDRNGFVVLKQITSISSPADTVNFDNTYSEAEITLQEIIKQVNVTYTSGLPTTEAFKQDWNTQPYSVLATTVNSTAGGILNVTSTSIDPSIGMYGLGSFNPNTYKVIEIKYRITDPTVISLPELYFINSTYTSASEAFKLTGDKYIADGQWRSIFIDCSKHASWTTGGNITGWRFDWANANAVTMDIDYIRLIDNIPSDIAIVSQPDTDVGKTLTLDNNTLINTKDRALAVGSWILSQNNGRRFKHAIDWRGNPAQELGDVIAIENSFTDNKNAIITKVDLTYEGYLSAKTEAMGDQ